MNEVFISMPLRTAISKFGGSLKDIPAPEIAGKVINAILEETHLRLTLLMTLYLVTSSRLGKK